MRSRPVRPNLSRVEGAQSTDDVPPLTPAQIRELKRRVLDLKDRRRFLLVSAFTARTAFYYDVSWDTWGMNDPSLGTLFKRRATATAVQRLLRDGVQVVRCRVDRRDRLIKKSVPRVRPAWRRKERGARA
jgi:hypothetical protein